MPPTLFDVDLKARFSTILSHVYHSLVFGFVTDYISSPAGGVLILHRIVRIAKTKAPACPDTWLRSQVKQRAIQVVAAQPSALGRAPTVALVRRKPLLSKLFKHALHVG